MPHLQRLAGAANAKPHDKRGALQDRHIEVA
jgi:hypothetical protein